MLAKLAVCHPGGSFFITLKGKRVNKDRPAIKELDIVGGGIFQHHPLLQGEAANLQGQQSSIFQHAE